MKYHVSKNLFDYSTITTGYRIQFVTGNDYADPTAVRSDYIPVNAGTYSCSDSVIVLGYDASKNYIGATNGNGVFEKIVKNAISQFTISANSECKYIKILSFYNAQMSMNIDAETMLNTGSQPLPYEPYSSEVWHDSHYIRGISTDTLTLPAVVYGDGTNATVNLKGNTETSGTPSPQNPVNVDGVGEMSSNLFDYTRTDGIIANTFINQRGNSISNNEYYMSYPIYVTEGEIYTWTFHNDIGTSHTHPTVAFYDASNTLIGAAQHDSTVYYFSFTIPNDCKYIRCPVFTRNNAQTTARLNLGAVSLPWEIFGYKIPISIGSNTTNIYIGENPLRKSLDGTAYDTLDADGTLTQRVDSDGSVLATPVVTQITMPTFTLADGANIVSVDTTVQPSEMTMTYHGWHPVSSAHERDNGSWT